MRIIRTQGNPDLATLFIAELPNPDGGKPDIIEFVESHKPPIPKDQKWVLIISTLAGCPVKCKFCDAGSYYKRKLTHQEIIDQIDYMITLVYPNRKIPIDQLKIHFGRMGEPSLNTEVLSVLKVLPDTYDAPGLFPSLSSVGPDTPIALKWYEDCKTIKDDLYGRKFQMQFSIHTTDERARKKLIPIKLLPFTELANIGKAFYSGGDRKITLNFALMDGIEVSPDAIAKVFDPDYFYIKMTPLNPTRTASRNNLDSLITESDLSSSDQLCQAFRQRGYQAELSWGESEENRLETNCGQFASSIEMLVE